MRKDGDGEPPGYFPSYTNLYLGGGMAGAVANLMHLVLTGCFIPR